MNTQLAASQSLRDELHCSVKRGVHAQQRQRLATERQRRGWSQQYVADQVKSTPLNVSRWERGLTTPMPYFRQKLVQLFQLSESELGLSRAMPESQEPQPTVTAQKVAGMFDPAIPSLALPGTFIGRETEMTTIKHMLTETQSTEFVALCGLPGIGKTAITLEIAHDTEIQKHFCDGILWAALGPAAQTLDILQHWGQLLGITAAEATALTTSEAWIQALRTTIGSRSFLVILDDVWHIEDALACTIGGPQCSYLLTSRFPQIALSFTAEHLFRLEELDEEQSFLLLNTLAPKAVAQEPAQVRALIQAVGRLPLALTLMGNSLRSEAYSEQPRRIRAALQRLQDAHERFHLTEQKSPLTNTSGLPGTTLSLQAVIALSDHHLPTTAQHALQALSVMPAKPQSFSEEEALAVCDCAVEVLDQLSDAGLLESVGPGRYALHQIISDYARLRYREACEQNR